MTTPTKCLHPECGETLEPSELACARCETWMESVYEYETTTACPCTRKETKE